MGSPESSRIYGRRQQRQYFTRITRREKTSSPVRHPRRRPHQRGFAEKLVMEISQAKRDGVTPRKLRSEGHMLPNEARRLRLPRRNTQVRSFRSGFDRVRLDWQNMWRLTLTSTVLPKWISGRRRHKAAKNWVVAKTKFADMRRLR